MLESTDKVALVTGASGGIGREIARRLAADGHLVLAHYGRDAASAAETQRLIEDDGGEAIPVGADLTRVASIEQLFDRIDDVLAQRGLTKLDVLVNNAGIAAPGSIDAVDEAAFDRLFDTNTKGTFFVTQQAVERMRDGGRIVNISSMVSRAAYPRSIAYGMSKAAINSFSVSLAAGLGDRGISVNAVAPGATETPFIGAVISDPDRLAGTVAGTALGRLGQPRDIAGVVGFLASDDGAWITGQVIEASGGMHL
ncbi:SDR family NAD(P)-dependent oxidoreductase [Agromyces sp. Marseille-P2726]|uniref:SDR family NAD(P)-dependent oxidoreductase n=1 Tax=Agromyces sp. Marseille-P2726 TaxID=2709132 RepID=UPI00156DD211|nr:SDR family oxidoreductase [Agromyces sp. Marseille-P2726]